MKQAQTWLVLVMFLALTSHALFGQAQNSAQAVPAAVPRLVNFSGHAADAAGKPISGIAGITFSIYKDQYEGGPLWMETQNVQADAKGNFVAQLGASKPAGLPLELFTTGEARWLGVRVNGAEEQPRVLLLSVPYALKAADAQTLGGLPPSAFVLAAPAAGSTAAPATDSSATSPAAAVPPAATSNVTTTGGTVNAIPLWTTATNVQSSLLTQTGTTGVNVAGKLNLPPSGMATATKGFNSRPETFASSAYNSSTKAATAQTFLWQGEPAGNNTAAPSGTLNLLFGAGTAAPAETGLKINNKGVISFAAGQTFPASVGTVTSVALSAPSSDFTVTGSPVTTAGTLNLAWNVAPSNLNTPGAIVKRDPTGGFQAGSIAANSFLSNYIESDGGVHLNAIVGLNSGATVNLNSGNNGVYGGTNDAAGNGVWGNNPAHTGVYGTGVIGLWGQGSAGGFGVYGIAPGTSGQGVWGESYGTGVSNNAGSDGVHGVTHTTNGSGVAGINTNPNGVAVYGNSQGFAFQAVGHASQIRTGGGWVKAMVYVQGTQAPYTILRCFNSTLAGTAATTPPCGFTLWENGVAGRWLVDFGFEVDDRFYSATSATFYSLINALPGTLDGGTSTETAVWLLDPGSSNFKNGDFTLIVF